MGGKITGETGDPLIILGSFNGKRKSAIIPVSLSSATNLICNLLIIRNYLYRKPKTEDRKPYKREAGA